MHHIIRAHRYQYIRIMNYSQGDSNIDSHHDTSVSKCKYRKFWVGCEYLLISCRLMTIFTIVRVCCGWVTLGASYEYEYDGGVGDITVCTSPVRSRPPDHTHPGHYVSQRLGHEETWTVWTLCKDNGGFLEECASFCSRCQCGKARAEATFNIFTIQQSNWVVTKGNK